jgi:uncharacterized protein (TIGR02217 family)
MTLYATEINISPGFGWQGGPEFNTHVVALQNGNELRNANWSQVRHRYILPLDNIQSDTYLAQLKAAFFAMRGQLNSFLGKDFSDFEATAESLGVAPSGSTAVQLIKISTFGAATYVRTISKPLVAGFTLYQNGIAKPGTLDPLTGLFTPTTAWTAGQALTWTGEFRVPVRFSSDMLPMTINDKFNGSSAYAMTGSIELVEVFGE